MQHAPQPPRSLHLSEKAQELAAKLIVPQPGRVAFQRLAVECCDILALPFLAFELDRATLRCEGRLRDSPAIVLGPDHVLGGDPDIRRNALGHVRSIRAPTRKRPSHT
jgi:hypothetical protein